MSDFAKALLDSFNSYRGTDVPVPDSPVVNTPDVASFNPMASLSNVLGGAVDYAKGLLPADWTLSKTIDAKSGIQSGGQYMDLLNAFGSWQKMNQANEFLKMGKEQFAFQKQAWAETNKMNKLNYNMQLDNRQAARYASNSKAYDTVDVNRFKYGA